MHVRNRINETTDKITERLSQVLLIGPMVMLVILLPRVQWSRLRYGWIEWTVAIGAALWVVWLAHKIVLLRSERKAWQAGYLGEIATAKALNQLTTQGCILFHSLPTAPPNHPHTVFSTNHITT